uniref:Aa_trans domain-containing protein n=1 Tax=Syphacia muris TaxID=451379 RepID=A0A0N5AK22_9BILA
MRRGIDEYKEDLLLEDDNTDDDEMLIHRSDEEERYGWSSKAALPVNINHWPYVFNLTNCIVGVSVLAMPYCLQQCGILLGTVLIGVCSYITKLSCHILYKGAVMQRSRTYPSFAHEALGSGGQRLVEVLMFLYLMSSCVSFMVVIGDVGPQALAEYLQLQAPTQRLRVLVMVFVLLFIIFPLSTIRNLDSLSIVSYVTVMFYGIFVIRMLIESIPRLFDGKWALNVYWWRQEGVLTSLPIIAMGLSCQTQLFDIVDCVKDCGPRKIDTIVSGAVNICSGIYAAVGLFGYLAFHDIALHGDILLYLQSTVLTQILKIGFILSIAFSVPLMLFPCRNTCYNFFKLQPEYSVVPMPPSAFMGITVTLLFLIFFVAIFVPNVEFVLGLTGALIGSTVAIIIPSFLFIQVCDTSRRNRWLVRGAKATALAGMFMLVCSTWAVLHTEQGTIVVDVIQPKQQVSNDVADANYFIKTPLNLELSRGALELALNNSTKIIVGDYDDLIKDKTDIIELGDAKKILAEIRKQQKEQGQILKAQKAIVEQLNKHHELHQNDDKLEKENESDDLKKRDANLYSAERTKAKIPRHLNSSRGKYEKLKSDKRLNETSDWDKLVVDNIVTSSDIKNSSKLEYTLKKKMDQKSQLSPESVVKPNVERNDTTEINSAKVANKSLTHRKENGTTVQ